MEGFDQVSCRERSGESQKASREPGEQGAVTVQVKKISPRQASV